MKLLITGGCGFLGSNLAAHALALRWDLTVFDNLSRLGSQQNLDWLKDQGQFRFVPGDIRNKSDVDNIIKVSQPDAVFHLAGQVAMTTSISDPRLDFEINAGGTFNLLEAVRLHAKQSIVVYSSTNKVYGDLEQYRYEETETRYVCIDRPNGFGEDTPLDFHSPYGCSKGSADQYMLDYARIFGLRTAVFRHSSMYGGRQFATYEQGWVGWFCQMAHDARHDRLSGPFTISGNGKQVRDVLHAEDMIRLYFLAIDRIDRIEGRALNIGGGMSNSMSLLELFALLSEFTGANLKFTKLPARQSDQRVFVADIEAANKLIGWAPQVKARDGIKKMLEWIEFLNINHESR